MVWESWLKIFETVTRGNIWTFNGSFRNANKALLDKCNIDNTPVRIQKVIIHNANGHVIAYKWAIDSFINNPFSIAHQNNFKVQTDLFQMKFSHCLKVRVSKWLENFSGADVVFGYFWDSKLVHEQNLHLFWNLQINYQLITEKNLSCNRFRIFKRFRT
jgi:hypothetical protein